MISFFMSLPGYKYKITCCGIVAEAAEAGFWNELLYKTSELT